MPQMYNVTLKEGAPKEEIEKAKEQAKQQGGTIKHEYKLITGFTVEFPDGAVITLSSNDHVYVEQDSPVRTQ